MRTRRVHYNYHFVKDSEQGNPAGEESPRHEGPLESVILQHYGLFAE
jgi:hypothetical protein